MKKTTLIEKQAGILKSQNTGERISEAIGKSITVQLVSFSPNFQMFQNNCKGPPGL